MPGPLELIRGFHVSKKVVYFDGDPMPYVGEVKVPEITCPVETFDNTSTGGPIEVADGFRRMPTGDGEVKFEVDGADVYAKIADATRVVSMNVSIVQNAYNPQLGQFLPLPISFKIGAQMFSFDSGTIKAGTKREIMAKYKMLSYKVTVNANVVIDFDFLNSKFIVGGADLLSAVQAIL